jgi:protein-L-isoaspartate O-methyltransferase
MVEGSSILFETAEKYLDRYVENIAGVVYDLKGIRPSEGFFMFAILAADPPRRILESGRARGYSTDILSRCFPDAEIISIESQRDCADADMAAKRLAGRHNIQCRFGDARVELPRLIEPGDVVLIDGPKDFRALKLALRLLQTGRARGVFVHDLAPGIHVRRFLEKRISSTLFSDNREFLSRYGFVGTGEPRPPSGGRLSAAVVARLTQGAMGFIPAEPRSYTRLLVEATLLQWKERLRHTLKKRFNRSNRKGGNAG